VIDELNDANNAAGTARTETAKPWAQALALRRHPCRGRDSPRSPTIDKSPNKSARPSNVANNAIGRAKAVRRNALWEEGGCNA